MPAPRLTRHLGRRVARRLPRPVDTLWTLFTAPTIWAAHFLFAYVGAAVSCAKGLGLAEIRVAIAVATLLALAAIAVAALLASRQWGWGRHTPPHQDDSPEDRRRFQGFATLLLSALSAVAVVFTALPALMITECVR